ECHRVSGFTNRQRRASFSEYIFHRPRSNGGRSGIGERNCFRLVGRSPSGHGHTYRGLDEAFVIRETVSAVTSDRRRFNSLSNSDLARSEYFAGARQNPPVEFVRRLIFVVRFSERSSGGDCPSPWTGHFHLFEHRRVHSAESAAGILLV